MAFNQQAWVDTLSQNIYDENAFYTIGQDHSAYAYRSTVTVPNASSVPTTLKLTAGYSTATAVRETYTDLTYSLNTIATVPTYVDNIDAAEASFDTRSAQLRNIITVLKPRINHTIAYVWATEASASIIRTSSATTRANIFGNTVIKKLTFDDVMAARMLMETQMVTIPEDLYLFVDPFMANDLLTLPTFVQSTQFAADTYKTGFIGTIGGINVIKIAQGIPYASTGATKVAQVFDGSAYAATSLSAALLVSGSAVSYAVSEPEVYFQEKAPLQYASIISSSVRVAGSPLYKAVSNVQKGVISIVETK